jgi:hypothetical protein
VTGETGTSTGGLVFATGPTISDPILTGIVTLPSAAAPTVAAVGEIAQDNNLWAASRGSLITYDGTAATALIGVLVSDTPSNGQVPKWNTGGTITWENDTGGGTGCVTGGSATQVLTDDGATGCTSNAAFLYTGGVATLGTAGSVVGQVALKNATSGTLTLSPPTGALGTVTVTIPAATDTLVNLAGTQTLTNKTLTAPIISTISNTGTVTLFTASDTVVGKATTDTLTNKTYDAEGTGNSLTIPVKIWLPAAGCNNATASTFWDLPTSTPAVPACVTGTNTQKGVLDIADTSGGFTAQNSLMLPADFSGTVDANIFWTTTATTGNAKWSLSTICTATNAAETDDAAFNTASTVTTAAPGTANRIQTSTITTLTVTGCAASEFMHLKILRDGNDAADTIAATARLIGVELTYRRAM